MPRIIPALLIVSCLLCSCQPTETPVTSSRTVVALGTLVTIEIDGVDASVAGPALDRIETYLYDIQREWYAFGDGELGRVNQALSSNRPAEISVQLADLTRRSLILRELSDGLFDPTIGLLVEIWGFGDADNPPRAPPSEARILEWRRQKNASSGILVDGQVIHPDRPVKLTFGAVAKGTALNETIGLLIESGIANAIVEAGGDLKVIGQRDNRPWRIGIRDPHSTGILGTVELAPGEAIVTSGDYERFFEHEGRKFHHLLDPRTGRPVTHTAGVTVIHPDAELADAAATALMVAGTARFREIADRMSIDHAMLVTSTGDIIMTPELAARIREPAPSHGVDLRIM